MEESACPCRVLSEAHIIAANEAEITALPDVPAVFVCRLGEGEPYVNKTRRLRSRIQRLLDPAWLGTKRLTLAGRVTAIEYWPVFSDFESRWTHYSVLQREFPSSYRSRMRLRPAPFVRISWKNEFPRAALTRKISLNRNSNYYGPFASRKDADRALQSVLEQFQVRRCIEDLAPHSAHAGCIYGEMKQCLAPCQLKVDPQQYRAEVERLAEFLATHGAGRIRELEGERDIASADLDFERAAQVHTKLQKFKSVAASLGERVRRLDQWNAVFLLPGASADALRIFRVDEGSISGPVEADFSAALAESSKTRALGIAVQERVERIPRTITKSNLVRAEHMALLARWMYRNPKKRLGELIQSRPRQAAESGSEEAVAINPRRLALAAERMLKGEGVEAGDKGIAGDESNAAEVNAKDSGTDA